MASAPPRPHEPFDRWPVQRYEEELGFLWLTEPGIFVYQATVEYGSVDLVHRLQDVIDEVLAANPEMVEANGGLLFFHDVRSIRRVERGARQAWVQRVQRRRETFGRGAIVAVSASPTIRMIAQTITMLVVVGTAGRAQSRVVAGEDLPAQLRRHQVVVPRDGARPAALTGS